MCRLLICGMAVLLAGCGNFRNDCGQNYDLAEGSDAVCLQDRGDDLSSFSTFARVVGGGCDSTGGLALNFGVCDGGCVLWIGSEGFTQYYRFDTGDFIGLLSHGGTDEACPNGTYWPVPVLCNEKITLGIFCVNRDD